MKTPRKGSRESRIASQLKQAPAETAPDSKLVRISQLLAIQWRKVPDSHNKCEYVDNRQLSDRPIGYVKCGMKLLRSPDLIRLLHEATARPISPIVRPP